MTYINNPRAFFFILMAKCNQPEGVCKQLTDSVLADRFVSYSMLFLLHAEIHVIYRWELALPRQTLSLEH